MFRRKKATFNVAATGTVILTYQWQKAEVSLVLLPTLTINPVSTTDGVIIAL
jgi:hypothetical protein